MRKLPPVTDRPPTLQIMRKLGLEPDPWQIEVIKSEHTQILLNCCRQAGKSTVVALLGLVEGSAARRAQPCAGGAAVSDLPSRFSADVVRAGSGRGGRAVARRRPEAAALVGPELGNVDSVAVNVIGEIDGRRLIGRGQVVDAQLQ